ncbi:hypothetical protein Bpfe_016826 [Biomphalaria pfeifferi]|uniref:Methyltransferase domain-containing protein n=1 Tax=Biomphalaria pfeifferi TaxID=112525 RepID=A0AAD8BFU4_BIOPF|nr:hypothetical protein Bpfe_016826 [Biomphalaria pfeifferi]
MSGDYKTLVGQITINSHIGFTLALAKDVGIIDALVISDTPLTTSDIAKQKHLKERYVQEILGCLVSVGFVNVKQHESLNRYYISSEGKEVWQVGGFRSSVLFINALMEAYNPVKSCVFADGPYGVNYGAGLMRALDESKTGSENTIKLILGACQGLKERLEEGISVTELGSGWGRTIGQLATLFPKSKFIASDYSDELVNALKAKWGHLANISFAKLDACHLPTNSIDSVDWIFVIDVIHDLPHPVKALEGIQQMLDKERGLFTAIEIVGSGCHALDAKNLGAAQMYSMSTFLCLPESFQNEDSEAHGACWSKELTVEEFKSAGFCVDVVDLEGSEGREILLICKPVKS